MTDKELKIIENEWESFKGYTPDCIEAEFYKRDIPRLINEIKRLKVVNSGITHYCETCEAYAREAIKDHTKIKLQEDLIALLKGSLEFHKELLDEARKENV